MVCVKIISRSAADRLVDSIASGILSCHSLISQVKSVFMNSADESPLLHLQCPGSAPCLEDRNTTSLPAPLSAVVILAGRSFLFKERDMRPSDCKLIAELKRFVLTELCQSIRVSVLSTREFVARHRTGLQQVKINNQRNAACRQPARRTSHVTQRS